MENANQSAQDQRADFVRTHWKQSTVILIVLVLAIIGVCVGRAIYLNINNATLKVLVAPDDAKVLIGGKRYRNGEHHIKPGEYEVKITRDGFEEYTSQVSIEEKGYGEVYLCMNNTDGVDWYSNNEKYAHLCDVVNEHQYDKEMAEKFSDKIFSVTPFHSYEKGFNIDAQLNEETKKITVTIEPLSCRYERAKALEKNALEWLEKAGVNPSDYTIEYYEPCVGEQVDMEPGIGPQ
jgi:hypothetical protein